jgi:tRNA pseudouridine55 synthase
MKLHSGYLLINKPKGITSFRCVNHIKKLLPQKKIKVGHAGTLDPFATGLLLICIGRECTKSLSKLFDLDKTYVVKAKLGELTDTLDLTGEIIETCNYSHITKELLEKAIADFGTTYEQTPPIFSALKHKGSPLYKLAREKKLGIEELEKIIEKKKRTVTIHELKLLDFDPPYFSFRARVSKGTYIRSLANDIAKKLDSCATTYELERTNIGPFSLERATNLNKITDSKTLSNLLFQIET